MIFTLGWAVSYGRESSARNKLLKADLYLREVFQGFNVDVYNTTSGEIEYYFDENSYYDNFSLIGNMQYIGNTDSNPSEILTLEIKSMFQSSHSIDSMTLLLKRDYSDKIEKSKLNILILVDGETQFTDINIKNDILLEFSPRAQLIEIIIF